MLKMKNSRIIFFVCMFFIYMVLDSCSRSNVVSDGFVKVKNGVFILDGVKYNFAGTNYWQGMHLGSTDYGNREQMVRELDQLKSYGITNLRIMASSEADSNSKYCMQPPLMQSPGVYDDNLFEGLDFLLSEMAKRDMKAVVVLSNYWTWSGGFAQYLKWAGYGDIPYPQDEGGSWYEYIHYAKEFLKNEKTLKWYEDHVKTVVGRVNTITGRKYSEDPTIMCWQLANEPRGCNYKEEFYAWISSTSRMIKDMAPKQLVSLGSEGDTPSEDAGLKAEIDNAFDCIDYITMHIWVQNWNWYAPGDGVQAWEGMIDRVDKYWAAHIDASAKLNKPLVLEEFGIARDSVSYEFESSIVERNAYYNYVYKKFVDGSSGKGAVQGVNFWSYSGEGRSPRPGEYWQNGDPFVGDPPHELQGWYGVYDTDISTLETIKNEIDKLK
jgi:mannan endo-1,4-beta-mannosidase